MNKLSYLQKLEQFVTDNNLSVDSPEKKRDYEKNEINERSNISLFPREIMPDVPDPQLINKLTDVEKYRVALANWLGSFTGEARLSDDFEKGMKLQWKLSARERELTKHNS